MSRSRPTDEYGLVRASGATDEIEDDPHGSECETDTDEDSDEAPMEPTVFLNDEGDLTDGTTGALDVLGAFESDSFG
jgi:hypothetical protein